MKNTSWSKYYNSIQDVCPFSGFAFRDGQILHVPFRGYNHILQNEQILKPLGLWATVYERAEGTPDEMSKWVEKRNSQQTKITYFFSHPEHSPNGRATHIPVIIQQRRDVLERARAGDFDIIRKEDSTDTTVNCQKLEKSKIPYGTKRKRK